MHFSTPYIWLALEKSANLPWVNSLISKFIIAIGTHVPYDAKHDIFEKKGQMIDPCHLCPLLLTWFNFNLSMDK